MMPMFLLDQKIDATEVSFWTGIICQGISICGSVLGGWLVTTFQYVVQCFQFNNLIISILLADVVFLLKVVVVFLLKVVVADA